MRFFRDLAITALITLAAGLGVEALLRIAHLHFGASLFTAEKERGFALRPNSHGWNVDEAEAYLTVNSDGLMDVERPIAAPSGALRVAVIGSSEAEGRQVNLDQRFETVLRQDLQRATTSDKVDVLNFGVAGYSASQEYVTLRDRVWKYSPQVVVLVVDMFALLRNTRRLTPEENGGGVPYFVVKNGSLEPDEITQNQPGPNKRRLYWQNRFADVMNSSEFLCLLNQARNPLRRQIAKVRSALRPATKPAPTATDTARALPADYIQRWPYLADMPEMQESWQIGDAFLDAMASECRRHGAEFRIVSTGMPAQLLSSEEERADYARRFRIPDLDATDRRLAQFGASRGIPVLLLVPALRELLAQHPIPLRLPGGGHWSPEGHKLVGDVMARDLLANSAAVRNLGTR